MDLGDIGIQQIIVIAVVLVVGTSLVQFLFKSLGKAMRWLFSAAVVIACIALLYQGGALEFIAAAAG